MRSMFPEQFRPTEEGFASLWTNGIFAVDTNVLLNLYRYSPETRQELEKALSAVKERLFIPHQVAKEFLKNRLNVTAGQAEEYTKAIKTITDLSTTLSNKKKHPFLAESELPNFQDQVAKLVGQLESQKAILLNRLSNDEILDFVASTFSGRTGNPFDESELTALAVEGEKRYEKDIPPGYKDGKKDASGDPYRKFGDLIIWRQIIAKAKETSKPIVLISDDQKEDWWLEQSGRTIGPRTELRAEFIRDTTNDFWMYTADRFIEETARLGKTSVNKQAIAEIIQVSEEVKAERIASYQWTPTQFKQISKDEMLERLRMSLQWAAAQGEGFLGLYHFVQNYLGHAGYDFAKSYDVINELHDEGLVEFHDHQGKGHDRPIRAIRLVGPDTFSNRPLDGLKSMIEDQAAKRMQ